MTGHAFTEVAAEVDGIEATFFLTVGSAKGSAFFHHFEHVEQAFDTASGDGVDRSGAEGVDADPALTEIDGEVSDTAFECGFCNAHDIVVSGGAGRTDVGDSDDAGIVYEEIFESFAGGDKAVGGNIEGEFEAFTGGVDETAFEVIFVGEGGTMDEKIDVTVFGFYVVVEFLEVCVGGEIAGEGVDSIHAFDEFFDFAEHFFVLCSDSDGGTLGVQGFHNSPTDTILIRYIENEPLFPFQKHEAQITRWDCEVLESPDKEFGEVGELNLVVGLV